MLPYQRRVADERADLALKVANLEAFINPTNGVFLSLLETEQNNLTTQLGVLKEYLTILNRRINAWLN